VNFAFVASLPIGNVNKAERYARWAKKLNYDDSSGDEE